MTQLAPASNCTAHATLDPPTINSAYGTHSRDFEILFSSPFYSSFFLHFFLCFLLFFSSRHNGALGFIRALAWGEIQKESKHITQNLLIQSVCFTSLCFSFFFPLIISQAWHIGMAKVLKKWEWDQVQKIPINSIKIQFKINLVLT